MQKHCIFEHFFRFVKQNRPKPSVIVTLHGGEGPALVGQVRTDEGEELAEGEFRREVLFEAETGEQRDHAGHHAGQDA